MILHALPKGFRPGSRVYRYVLRGTSGFTFHEVGSKLKASELGLLMR
jgi:hypothetical protein